MSFLFAKKQVREWRIVKRQLAALRTAGLTDAIDPSAQATVLERLLPFSKSWLQALRLEEIEVIIEAEEDLLDWSSL